MYIPASGSSVWAAITNGFRLTDAASQDIADLTHLTGKTYFKGADATADDLYLYANRTDGYPLIELNGNSHIVANTYTNASFNIEEQGSIRFSFTTDNYGFYFKETATSPATMGGFGVLYTKSDNNLYFRDGGGTEHTVAFI